MSENLNELLMTLIQVVIIPAIPVLVAFLVKLLKAKAEQTTVKVNNELVRQYLQEAIDAVLQAVTYTSQTYVDSLKAQGKFDAAAQKEAFNKAKETALTILTQESLELLNTITGDLETWLTTKIEQTVRESKNFITVTGQ